MTVSVEFLGQSALDAEILQESQATDVAVLRVAAQLPHYLNLAPPRSAISAIPHSRSAI